MDPSFPNSYNLGDSQEFSTAQYYENSQFYPNSYQVPVAENQQTSQNTEKQQRANKWDAPEDIALMSAWCMASEDSVRGKNQKKISRWARVKELYDAFRMRKPLFLRIVEAVSTNDIYFVQRCDATDRKGLSALQKCTGAMRVLAYGTSADAHDEYLRMSESVTRDALIKFVEGVISCFGQEYLRKPNENDLARLLHVGEERGFPGMIGSIDCMHWEWKNCPTAWAGQYAGRSGKPTIILEAVASYDLWIWHAFLGTPGTCNDINVIHRSPLFNDVLSGRALKVSYIVNGRENNRAYYLTDGIYPSWAAFVKSITSPQLRKHKLFAEHQEAARKDVERAFGVLQARFAFLRRPCLALDKDLMGKIMIACIIIHNMIVEDGRHTYLNYYDPSEFLNDIPTNPRRRTYNNENDDVQPFEYSTHRIADLSSYMTNRSQLRNREAHIDLRNDLIEHIWQKFGIDE